MKYWLEYLKVDYRLTPDTLKRIKQCLKVGYGGKTMEQLIRILINSPDHFDRISLTSTEPLGMADYKEYVKGKGICYKLTDYRLKHLEDSFNRGNLESRQKY